MQKYGTLAFLALAAGALAGAPQNARALSQSVPTYGESSATAAFTTTSTSVSTVVVTVTTCTDNPATPAYTAASSAPASAVASSSESSVAVATVPAAPNSALSSNTFTSEIDVTSTTDVEATATEVASTATAQSTITSTVTLNAGSASSIIVSSYGNATESAPCTTSSDAAHTGAFPSYVVPGNGSAIAMTLNTTTATDYPTATAFTSSPPIQTAAAPAVRVPAIFRLIAKALF